ncbi:lysozyme family protein [Ectobacillus sp. JY-23]|uniref:bifunctional lytic transglycosylase/C40 family peptidase n=1 Tax=Ectobacillus sp. JY-23 TaxID=2933872 RepID=UPI001FF63B32|nr:lysozyme family protein [Ectobacillus sp. JY-23]UOY92848.1 lysozyme family protein [Ectobacillus sp. JY-23]
MIKGFVVLKYWKELLVGGIFTCMLGFILLFGGSELSESKPQTTSVSVWEPVMRMAVQDAGLEEQHVPILLAIMMQESGGKLADIMQSSESAGLPPGAITDPEVSIRQGVKHWKSMLDTARKLGITDLATIIQSYNYGPGWLYYVKEQGRIGTEELRKHFSLSHATSASCGWRTPHCYGDYTYAKKVMKYLQGPGDTFQAVMAEALKYKGWPYSWGGATPDTSFDCSGLTKWAFAAAGIYLPRTAQEQFQYTKRISEQELRPGDLVFFTGTSDHAFISHVGIYVGNGMMYNSNSAGVEYSDLHKAVWREKIYAYGRAGEKQ